MYLDNQLNVDTVPGKTVDFELMSGIIKAVQVFPNDPDTEHMWTIYIEPSDLENVMAMLQADPNVDSVERIPLRTTATE